MKIFILSAVALMLSSPVMANPITLGKAQKIATLVAIPGKTVDFIANGGRLGRRSLTQLNDQSVLPYYIFSRGKGQGFVIVSGDDCLPQILGYTESGDYDEAIMPPALKEWLAQYAVMIEEAQKSGTNMPLNVRQANDSSVSRTDIPALVQTHWHQESPYNDKCPYMKNGSSRAMTGCVATAASQVVYYFHKDLPDSLMSTTPTYSYGGAPVKDSFSKGTPIKWGLMQPKYSGSEPTVFKDAVATFVAALGAATWLTYGTSDTDRSTSGQINNLVNTFNSYFNLNGMCKYKSGISQSEWETMIYDELTAGRPIVYSGVHPSNGGHAVVLDGYDAKNNLFHFNFGWGGQGDGWYTVNDETGMNGFSGQQGMVYGISPKRQNINASIVPVQMANKGRVNGINIKVNNNGTIPFSGLYVFLTKNNTLPEKLSSAVGMNLTTVINPNESSTVKVDYTPKSEGMNYLTVTDNNLNVLAQDTLTVENTACQLTLNKISVCGSSDREINEGNSYTVVYNDNSVMCNVEVSNATDINFSDRVYLYLDSSTDGGKTFENIGRSLVKLDVDAGQTTVVSSTFINSSTMAMKSGVYYKIYMKNPISTVHNDDIIKQELGADAAYFVLKPATLAATCNADNVCVFTGDWDERRFNALMSRSSNSKAIAYDLTAVKGIQNIPETKNPNTIFYVSDDTGVTGQNVVSLKTNSCKNLKLIVGNDFRIWKPFVAEHVNLVVNQNPNQWYLITSPAQVVVPNGMMAREISGHTVYGISDKTNDVQVLEAGKTYLLKTSSLENQILTGENSDIALVPKDNIDSNVKGCYTSVAIDGQAYLLNHDVDLFETATDGSVIEPLRGYFVKDNTITVSSFTCNSKSTLDPEYRTLGQTIIDCLELLDEYKPIVKETAYNQFSDAIVEAQKAYTSQQMTLKYQVTDCIKVLTVAADKYKTQLKEGQPRLDVDFTSLIVNPSFEKNNLSGWKGGTSVKVVKPSSNLVYTGVGIDGDCLVYCSGKLEAYTSLHQEVKSLQPGTYTLKAKVGTSENNSVVLYAGDKEMNVGMHPYGEYYLNDVSIEGIKVSEDSTLTIGIRSSLFYKADDFRLFCTATSGENNAIQTVPYNGYAPESSLLVRMDGNTVIVTTSKRQQVCIVNIYGQCVWQQTVEGTERIPLTKGLYIIGKKKVFVK